MNSKEIHLWLPEDKFLLNLVEEYGSLAMLCPRIQSPYDLIPWDHMKDNPLIQYKFVFKLKRFLRDWLAGKSLTENYKIGRKVSLEECDEKKNNADLPFADDVNIMSHPPVLGHWLEQSGFITDAMKKQDHEFNFSEYEKIFNDATINKTRKRLFPTFEGILIHDNQKYNALGSSSNDPDIKEKYFSNVLIYSTLHTISFDEKTGKFSNEDLKSIKKYEDRIEPIQITYPGYEQEDPTFITYSRSDTTLIPIMRMFNDTTFSSLDENKGFFNTNIYNAYNMNFDLNSQFEVSYDDTCKKGFDINYTVNRNGFTKHKITSTSLAKQSFITGKILGRNEYKGDINKSTINIEDAIDALPFKQKEYTDQGGDTSKCIIPPKPDELKEVIYKWNSYEKKSCDEIIRRDQSSFSSYEDYFNAYLENKSISRKEVNYFWFMYGSLPVNNLLYEDLFNGLSMRSKFMPDDDSSKNWSISDLQMIYFTEKPNNCKNYKWYEKENNYIVNENEYPHMLKLNQDCIKFFSLVYGLSNIRLPDHILNIKGYYTSNSSYSLMEKMEKFEISKHAYPNRMSANNESIADEDKVEFVNRREIVLGGAGAGFANKLILPEKMTQTDKSMAVSIMMKLNEDDVDLDIVDLQFLFSKGFMSGIAKEIYEKKIEPNKCRDKDSEAYKNLVKDIKSHKDLINTYIREVPLADSNEPTIPDELKQLDEKLKVANNLTNPIPIETAEKDNARAIKLYLTSSTSGKKIVSEKMLAYLVFLGLMNIDAVKNFKYVLSGKQKYFMDLTDTKYIQELNNFRSVNLFEDSSFKSESIAPTTPYIKEVFKTKEDPKAGGAPAGGAQPNANTGNFNWKETFKRIYNKEPPAKYGEMDDNQKKRMKEEETKFKSGGGNPKAGSKRNNRNKGSKAASAPP